jgi:hypothetical protein
MERSEARHWFKVFTSEPEAWLIVIGALVIGIAKAIFLAITVVLHIILFPLVLLEMFLVYKIARKQNGLYKKVRRNITLLANDLGVEDSVHGIDSVYDEMMKSPRLASQWAAIDSGANAVNVGRFFSQVKSRQPISIPAQLLYDHLTRNIKRIPIDARYGRASI